MPLSIYKVFIHRANERVRPRVRASGCRVYKHGTSLHHHTVTVLYLATLLVIRGALTTEMCLSGKDQGCCRLKGQGVFYFNRLMRNQPRIDIQFQDQTVT